jgi:hypothetical protein
MAKQRAWSLLCYFSLKVGEEELTKGGNKKGELNGGRMTPPISLSYDPGRPPLFNLRNAPKRDPDLESGNSTTTTIAIMRNNHSSGSVSEAGHTVSSI